MERPCMDDGFTLVAGFLAADIVWVLITIVLVMIGSVVPDALLSGPLFRFRSVQQIWISVGAIFGLGTGLSFLQLLGDELGGF